MGFAAARGSRRNRQNGHATAMAIVEPIDQMHVSRSAASCANHQGIGEVRLGTRCEGGDFLVPQQNPFDFILRSQGLGQSVEGVAWDTVDSFHSRSRESL